MVNPKKPDGYLSRELIPAPNDYARPAIPEPMLGDYYYGRVQNKSVIARGYLQMLHRQRKVIATVFLLVMGIGLAWILTRPPLYRSTSEMLITPMDRGSGNAGDNLAQDISTVMRVRSVATEMKLLSSPDLLDEAFVQLPASLRRSGFATAKSRLQKYPIAITNPRDTDVVVVEVTAKNPEAAARFANQIMRTSLRRTQETTKNIAEMATEHVSAELASCDTEWRAALADLSSVQSKYGVVDVSTAAAADVQALATLDSQVAQAQSEATQARMARQLLEKQLADASATVVASVVKAPNPVLQSINADIERLESKRAELLQEYLPTAAEVRSVDEQIADRQRAKAEELAKTADTVTVARNPIIDSMKDSYINAVVSEQGSASRASITRDQAGSVRGRIASLPKAQERIALLQSRIAELQSTHAYLNSQKQALTLSMSTGLPNGMPITAARANDHPVSPNIPVSLMLLLVISAMLALGVAVARDQLDDHLHTTNTLEGLTGRRVLVSLPRVQHGFHGLVTHDACPPALLESFRILRGNIMLSMPDPLPRTIMVTSAQAGDGKSTTVANLAATMAMNNKRVLILDCDMRHPSIHLIYGLQNARGLSAILLGEAEIADCVQQTEIDHLEIIAAGPTPSRPPELLSSPGMGMLLDRLRDRYDCILLDSTPMVNLSDGTILAALAEGVLVVVSSDRTRQPDLQSALRTLEQVGTPILGLVYNRSDDAPELDWRQARD